MRTSKLAVLIAVIAVAVAACSDSGGSEGTGAPVIGTPAPAVESFAGDAGTDPLAATLPPLESPAT